MHAARRRDYVRHARFARCVRHALTVLEKGVLVGPRSRKGSALSGNSSAVERQPSKLGVAGSNPVSRSKSRACAHVAQSVERVLGKDEVSGSIPDMGSISIRIATANGRV